MAFGGNPTVLGSGLPIASGGVSVVSGPSSSTDNSIVRWDGTGGNLVQNSVLIVADTTGALSGFTTGVGITWHGGGAITGASGSLDLTASGTNQNITLTPSGTGGVVLNSTNNTPSFALQTTGTTRGNLGTFATVNFGITANTGALIFQSNNAEAGRFTTSQLLLLGTTTDSSNGRIQLATHTTSAGGIGFGTDTALYRNSAGVLVLIGTGSGDTGLNIQRSGGTSASWTIYSPAGANSLIFRGGSGPQDALTIDSSQFLLKSTGSNGQSLNIKYLTELTTIAAAATTDTAIQMPAGAIILSVSVRVTVVIPTATNFTVGDSGSAARFSTAAVSSAANSTDLGTKAGAYYNASALSVRITPDATPADNTGRVRVTIAYLDVTVPTS